MGDAGQTIGRTEAAVSSGGDRRQVTTLFADLAGYTAMSESLDPEELRDVMSMVFGEIAQVIARYEGHVEKYIGDAVHALFGLPAIHEDDPVRAVRAARDIHVAIDRLSEHLQPRIDRPLAVHSGINTGVVVATGGNGWQSPGVLGEALTIASRLGSAAPPGEIYVSEETYRLTRGHFDFEPLGDLDLRGRDETVATYRLVSLKDSPTTVHRLTGRRSELVGRGVELERLHDIVGDLLDGRGTIVTVCGGPGAGKSRLVAELKATLDLERINWREGRAYAYTQNTPYYPLMNLLGNAWGISEGDEPEHVRERVSESVERVFGPGSGHEAVIGSLFELDYPELGELEPTRWREKLAGAVEDILAALTASGPTIVFLEDIHWADPSSIALLRRILARSRHPAIFICAYRPPFSLYPSHSEAGLTSEVCQIVLEDLSPSEADQMTMSLLGTDDVPSELRRFVREKAEGNPFYLEEVVNSLIESDALIERDGQYVPTEQLATSRIPLTIGGVLSARLDRLDPTSKQVLQEASAVGSVFSRSVLSKITSTGDALGDALDGLERLDLIRTRALEPEHEYAFKHALTQEVVYSGLLRKERQGIHQRIAHTVESLYAGRSAEVYETLAHHYALGRSLDKAVHYLTQAAVKSTARMALEEAHRYCEQAVELLEQEGDDSTKTAELLADVVLKWVLVFFYRGDSHGLRQQTEGRRHLVDRLEDPALIGKWRVWLGMLQYQDERWLEAHKTLTEAVELGERIADPKVVGLGCTWLTYVYADMGRLDQAESHGRRAVKIAREENSADLPLHLALGGLGYAAWVRGDASEGARIGGELLELGRTKSDPRALVFGYWVTGMGRMAAGEHRKAEEAFRRALRVSAGRWYAQFPQMFLGYTLVSQEKYSEAESYLVGLRDFCDEHGGSTLGTPSKGLLGPVMVAKGQMAKGLRMIEGVKEFWDGRGCRWRVATSDYVLGSVYMRLVERNVPASLSVVARNAPFLARTMPFARQRAAEFLGRARSAAEEIGAVSMIGQSEMALGRLHAACGRRAEATRCLSEAATCFSTCGATGFEKEALERLASVSTS